MGAPSHPPVPRLCAQQHSPGSPTAVGLRISKHPTSHTALTQVTSPAAEGEWEKAGNLLCLGYAAGQAHIAFPTARLHLFCICVYPQ